MEKTARRTAEILLEIRAVRFSASEPYRLASGRLSPVYIDCRTIIAYPKARSEIADMMVAMIETQIGASSIDNVAGGETAGIPFAAFAAERMGLPMSYVRKKPKGYGRNARIEGGIKPGQRVLLIEDLATDGGSKLDFASAIRDAGAACTDIAVVFQYGIFPEAEAELAMRDIKVHRLCSWKELLSAAENAGAIDQDTLGAVRRFLASPEDWRPAG